MLKVLHVCEADLLGGGSIAAFRLHQGLVRAGVDSRMLVIKKMSQDNRVILGTPGRLSLAMRLSVKCNRLFRSWTGFARKRHYVKYPGFGAGVLGRSPHFRWADVVHLHWVYRDVLSVSDIARIPVPVVWTTHELWCISDAVIHYYGEGDRAYEQKEIPRRPSTIVERVIRLHRLFWWGNRKQWVIGPSRWVAQLASTSPYYDANKTRYIGHYIDTNEWKPGNKAEARKKLDLPLYDRVCVFGATNIERNSIKGLDLILEAIKIFSTRYPEQRVTFVCFGNSKDILGLKEVGIKQLGKQTPEEVRLLYQAADCCLVASRVETFCLVVQEAMSCGVPCVAFPVGGIPEMIKHKESGYLVRPFDVDDYVAGMWWVMEREARLRDLQRAARESILSNYGEDNTIQAHIELYKEMLASAHG